MIVFLFLLSRVVPITFGYCLCIVLGVFAYNTMSKYRRIAMDNLSIAFGNELMLIKRKYICRNMFINMMKSLYEFIQLPRLSANEIISMVNLDSTRIRECLTLGHGVIILTAHLGNWELLAARLVAEGFKLTVIGKDLRDEWLSRLMIGFRESTGVRNVRKGKGLFKPIAGVLERNEMIGLLADQNAGTDGCFVSFFGKPASTFSGPAVFAAETGAAILPTFCIRQKDNSHKVIFHDPIFISSSPEVEKLYECIQKYTNCIEKAVKEYPEQWLWLHKRWKTRPDPVYSVFNMGDSINRSDTMV